MISVAREDPRGADIFGLLAASDALMAQLYPAEANLMLDVSALTRPEVAFFVARRGGAAVGCGAWVRRGPSEGELKRLFVSSEARGRGVGRALLRRIELDAAAYGIQLLVLETGSLQPEAAGLYRSFGYGDRAPFAPHTENPWSVFMEKKLNPAAITAATAPLRTKPSNYPKPFFSRMGKREKRPLGDLFGLTNFGVNLTKLAPGGESALLHRHSKQDEFIYVLEGEPTLVTEDAEIALAPGMCAGFPAQGAAHQLVNRTDRDVVYLEIGDRSPGDEGSYPRDDLKAVLNPDGSWHFTRKDGRPF